MNTSYGNVMNKISGNKNELALQVSNANQVIYGTNSSVDDDVIYDQNSVERYRGTRHI